MVVLTATLNQTAFLLLFIVAGYILSKWKFVPDNAHSTLSKLENYLLIPALVLSTFIENFTPQKLSSTWALLLGSLALTVLGILLSLVCARLCSKDKYERNIFAYGLSFSNFGFMGNAVVAALFPDIFLEYLIFTLPLWSLIYLWGAPVLLIGGSGGKQSLAQRAKSFLNPMFVCTILGMLIGLTGIPIPSFFRDALSSAGSCMSPVAMLLTGMTIAQFDLRAVLRIKGVYVVTALRLLAYPLLFLGVLMVLPLPRIFATCAVCALAMPLGLNAIIIPSAMGKDTRMASGMALVSHVLSCITIPVILMLFDWIIQRQ